MDTLSLQQRYAPKNACFGCGPANVKGLHLQSFPKDEKLVVAEWLPKPEYEAFPGVLNGGIIGALLDCHSNWTAAWYLMKQAGESVPPCTVTAEYSVKLRRPTPSNTSILLEAFVTHADEKSAEVEASLISNGKVCATCKGRFVSVPPTHPAYHRW